jgi:hypothetical protein
MRRINQIALFCLAAFAGPSFAADVMVEAVPTNWRMEDYLGGAIDIWYSGSSCANGHMVLSAATPADVRSRFWSLVLTAKATGKYIGVFYDDTSSSCLITHFYSKEQ